MLSTASCLQEGKQMGTPKKTASVKVRPRVAAKNKVMVGVRATEAEIELLDSAAIVERRSRQEFVLYHAIAAARKATAAPSHPS